MTHAADLDWCREAIRTGSFSFHAASQLLPAKVRNPALALYAFCRLADDAVDETSGGAQAKATAVLRLRDRLDAVYAGQPVDAPADRAFARVVDQFTMPRALPEALLEGLAWDAAERRYATLSELRGYSARVASAVGAMMCVLMEVRDRNALSRACDLGVAMQLTNIARDVGEDARAGRLYLPTKWLEDAGLNADHFLQQPRPDPEIRIMTKRLLAEARRLYDRSEAGVASLPLRARPGILAARHIYAGIGSVIAANGYDSISQRAVTKRGQKLRWLGKAITQSAWVTVMPQSPVLYAKPLDEVAFLVDAAADPQPQQTGWSDSLITALAQLEARDRGRGLTAR